MRCFLTMLAARDGSRRQLFSHWPAGDASTLVVLVETNPAFWEGGHGEAASIRSAGFASFMQQLVPFVQAFMLLNAQNRLAVIAMHCNRCPFLYDSLQSEEGEGASDDAYAFSGTAGEIIVRRAKELLVDGDSNASTPLSG